MSLVVRRAADVTDAHQVLGYLHTALQHTSAAPEPRTFTALGADGALWTFQRLLDLASDPAAEDGAIELRSAFQKAAHRLTVARRPFLEQPARADDPVVTTSHQSVIVEGTDLDDLIFQLRSIDGAQRKNHTTPGGLRLVFDLDDSSDPAVRRAHVASALCSGQGHGPNLIHANSSSGNITAKE